MRKASSQHPESNQPPRDRHGDRSVPPPLTFDLFALPDSTMITECDVAAAGRWARSTVEKWRQQPDHPLKWLTLPGGFVRTTVGDLKRFLASGKPRKRERPRKHEPSQDAAPAPRRRTGRPRAEAVSRPEAT